MPSFSTIYPVSLIGEFLSYKEEEKERNLHWVPYVWLMELVYVLGSNPRLSGFESQARHHR